jgi:hypothetical protein
MVIQKPLVEYVANCGYKYTEDIFIVPENVYIRAINTEHHITQHPSGIVCHRQIDSNKYICWNYGTGLTREIDVLTYNTQLKVFNLLSEDEDFFNTNMEEILDKDLSQLASQSCLMFNR